MVPPLLIEFSKKKETPCSSNRLADTAKAALEKSLNLDAEQPMARYSLAQFYINAPGIAGGSLRKAREQAKLMFAMKDGKGDFLGHLTLALTAAETGHLCFATLHTTDAAQTVDRIIDVFPPHQQQQVRVQLSTANTS
jgi:hypothetical protein